MLPEMTKPATIGEETFTGNRWTPRGDWRQRVRTEKSRNLRDPNMMIVFVRESDVLIVVKKQGNSCGAKGDDCKYVEVKI